MPDNLAKVPLKILPNAARNEILGLQNGVWRIKIAAQPEKGKANKELIAFLSQVLALKKDNLTIMRGLTSHNKLISIEGLSLAEVNQRLSSNK